MTISFNDLIRIEKKEKPEHDKADMEFRFSIQKSDNDKHLAFGWANIAFDEQGNELADWQNDMIDEEDLENAAYNYVLRFRGGGEMHKDEIKNKAILVESMVFTKQKMVALKIPEGTLPVGWWIGFYVPDNDLWEKVKNGTYPMFSIQGSARRVPVDDDGNEIQQDGSGEDENNDE